jgi:NAD(P)-dependent dehydrogenase (short-subunit alcohol dehydrogenase family)
MNPPVVLTGATSGVGAATAHLLARNGHDLILINRDAKRSERLQSRLERESRVSTFFIRADLSRPDGLVQSVELVRSASPSIAALINNAGVMLPRREVTSEGLELTFAINHAAPFVLSLALLPQLRAAKGRVVNVNSEAHRALLIGTTEVRIDFDDLQSGREYDPFVAYSRSKLANLLFTFELHRRLQPDIGVTVNAIHPGLVRTRLGRRFSPFAVQALYLFAISPKRSAVSVANLAVGSADACANGCYFDRDRLVSPSPASQDRDVARRLWDETARLVAGTLGRLRVDSP